ncbi:MAG TPA: hypothetical protein VJP02_08195 [Candidatus Sulfotelmatobacter sp.]|nr:hypothetical protein [Candidatus Sulfotelmatobacter sp.]
MRFDIFSFGSIQIDGSTYEHDVIVDRGEIRKRRKTPSKKFREQFGHTPPSIQEEIPWQCHQLIIGSGAYGRLPVMQGVQREAERHKIKLLVLPAFVESKLEAPKHLAWTVHDLYFEPKYEEFRLRTIWSLCNAFTSAFKELDAIPQFKATAKLGEFLEARFSQSF